jgi:hypothetical protein
MTHMARTALEQYSREHPRIWQHVDRARTPPRSWPSQVFLPQKSAGGILTAMNPGLQHGRLALSQQAMFLSMFAAWRTTQGIYRFHEDFYAELIETPLMGKVPVEAFLQLPEWCVYVETPGMKYPLPSGPADLAGLWTWLDWREGGRTPLTLAFALRTTAGIAFVHLPLAGTVEQSLLEMGQTNYGAVPSPVAGWMPAPIVQDNARAIARVLGPILSLLLYLCTDIREIGDGTRRPQNPQPRYFKGQERMSAAEKPVEWEVGVRLGTLLRKAREQEAAEAARAAAEGRRYVRPYVRRGHWAHRWVGPMNGERKLVLRWIHPVLVNATSPDDLPSVIWTVGAPSREPGDSD